MGELSLGFPTPKLNHGPVSAKNKEAKSGSTIKLRSVKDGAHYQSVECVVDRLLAKAACRQLF
jgi:hypothetical protein